MRIFISYNWSQKQFVHALERALAETCPKSIEFVIDDTMTKKGEDFKAAIDKALGEDCALCLLIIDHHSVRSEWVGYEIERMKAREAAEGRPFMIPIVLSEEAWQEIAPKIGEHRTFIRCYDQQDDSIRLAAARLSKAIFEWLADFESKSSSKQSAEAPAGTYVAAESTFVAAANALKNAIYPFRQECPATVPEILARVNETAPGLFKTEAELRKALEDLRQQNYLHGYYFDGDVAFLIKERFHDKTTIKIETKQRLAKLAARMVSSEQTIALDGGTTTLAIASELCIFLSLGTLYGLRVFTNSLPVAMRFVETLALKNAGDRDSTCQVYLLGGNCRPSTMCTTIDDSDAELTAMLGGLDIAFIGASGLVGSSGFGVTNQPEVAAKTAFQANAKVAAIICDSSKFEVRQTRLTNPPVEGMVILTESAVKERLERLKAENPAWAQVEARYCD